MKKKFILSAVMSSLFSAFNRIKKEFNYHFFQQYFQQFIKQFSRFIVIGILSTLISFSCFYLLINLFSLNYLIANFISFLCGIAFSYPINKKWSFNHQSEKSSLLRYFLVYLFSLILSMIILKIGVQHYKIKAEIVYIISIFITTITNFCGIKFLVFARK